MPLFCGRMLLARGDRSTTPIGHMGSKTANKKINSWNLLFVIFGHATNSYDLCFKI
jgi:hypothetical protein